jgi:hypothetical protein
LFFIANGIDVSLFRAVESQRDDARKEGLQRGSILDELQNERSDLRNSIVGFQTSIKRLESEREDIVKCLEEARKRIAGIVNRALFVVLFSYFESKFNRLLYSA